MINQTKSEGVINQTTDVVYADCSLIHSSMTVTVMNKTHEQDFDSSGRTLIIVHLISDFDISDYD